MPQHEHNRRIYFENKIQQCMHAHEQSSNIEYGSVFITCLDIFIIFPDHARFHLFNQVSSKFQSHHLIVYVVNKAFQAPIQQLPGLSLP
jgi:hypothetical protein